jgi:hypothetical protein
MVKYQSSRAFLEPTPETFAALEKLIEWAELEVPRMLRKYMNELVFHMALVNQGIARKMSFGPFDPSQSNPNLAWRTPEEGIRRISQRYFVGWKVKQIAPAVWQLYNDSREAYYIEFGIHTSLHRIRRPVRKLSLRRTMEFILTTGVYHRVWVDIYANPRYRHRGMGFQQHVGGAGAAVTGNLRGAYVGFTSPFMFGQSQRVSA